MRDVRRRVTQVGGTIERSDGSAEPVTADLLLRGNEGALRALTVAVVTMALALVIMRVT